MAELFSRGSQSRACRSGRSTVVRWCWVRVARRGIRNSISPLCRLCVLGVSLVNSTSKTRIGVCSWSLRPENAGDLIKGLQRPGIRAVQLALNPIIDNQEGWQEAIRLLRSSGVRIISGMIAMAGEDYSTLESIRQRTASR